MSKTNSIFKQALQTQWEALAPVIQAHYGLSPFTDQRLLLKGKMESVSHSTFAAILNSIHGFGRGTRTLPRTKCSRRGC